MSTQPEQYRGTHMPMARMTEEQIDRLLDAAKFDDLRDFVVIDLCYELLARISEVLDLRVGDVLLDERKIIVRRKKRGVDNILPVTNDDVWTCIVAACERRGDRAALLFDGYSRRTFDWRLKRLCSMIGIPEHFAHAHALRHSACQHVMDQTGSIMITKVLAGHRDVGSTLEYCDMSTDEALAIKEAYGHRLAGIKRAAAGGK